MVVLKKIKASSLTEVLVASTIILIVFGIAIASIDNMLKNNIQHNTHVLETEMNILMYQYQNNQLKTPQQIENTDWIINIEKVTENSIEYIKFEGIYSNSKKKITKKSNLYEEE